jgi:hypothetical protein
MMAGMTTTVQLQARLQPPGDLGRAARALWPSVATREALQPTVRPLLARLDNWAAERTRSAERVARARHTREVTAMKPDLRSFLPSLLRTIVPLIVGVLIGVPVVKALGISTDQLSELVTAGITALYWLAVRGLERYAGPQFGWLLGYAAQPVYVHPFDAGRTDTPAGDVARVVGA